MAIQKTVYEAAIQSLLNDNKNKILILGAGTWQIPWLVKAKELGFTVFATDWSDTAEGRHIPHHFAPIDLRNKEETLAFAREHQVNAVFTSADIGVQTAAYVAAHMGLPYHSEELAFQATNKFAMREKARSIGLGIPQYQLVETLLHACEAAIKIGYPVIIKPVDSFSSRGVSVIFNQKELEECFPATLSASFAKKVLVEEFMVYEEGSVEALVQNNIPKIMGVCKKQKSPLPYRYDLILEYPGDYTALQQDLVEKFINQLVTGFGIKNGVIHVELMIGQDEVKLIEFAIRGCGSKVITHLMPALTDYDVMTYLLLNAFDVQLPIEFSREYHGVLKFIMLPKGKIKQISDKTMIRNMPGILEFDIERESGDVVDEIIDGRSRPGYLLAYSKSKDDLTKVVDNALNAITVEYE